MLGSVSNNLRIPRVRNLKGTAPTTPAAISADFTARVVAAGGSLTATEQNAVLALVTSMIANGTWAKTKVIYPMVGGSANSCAQNLVNSSYVGYFFGGWTFASTGATPNGTNAWMNTFFIPSNSLTAASSAFGYYSRSNTSGAYTDMGTQPNISLPNRVGLALNYSGTAYFDLNNYNLGRLTVTGTTSTGLYMMSRTSTTVMKAYRNGAQFGTTNTNTMTDVLPNSTMFVGGMNFNDGINFGYTNRECAFAHMSDGLSDAEASSLYTNVQTFQTSLSRQV